MASSRNETALAWSSVAYVDITSGSNATSDAFTFNIEDWDASLTLYADNQGTPASGDTLDVYVEWTSGSVDGSAGDDYDTAKGAQWVARLNTYSTDSDGEDPQQKTVQLPNIAAKGLKVYAKNNSGGRTIRLRAEISTHRPQ
jgi:hypothetical protein